MQPIQSSGLSYPLDFFSGTQAEERVAPRYQVLTTEQDSCCAEDSCVYAIGNGLVNAVILVARAIIFVVAAPFVLIGMLFQALFQASADACTGSENSGRRQLVNVQQNFHGNSEQGEEVDNQQGSSSLQPPPTNLENLPIEAVDLGAGYDINVAKRAEVPDPINWQATLNQANGAILLNDLLICFDQVFGTDPNRASISNCSPAERDSRRGMIKTGYVDFINRRTGWYGAISPEYYDQIGVILKCVIAELKKPDVSQVDKILALEILAEASDKCPPRRLNEVIKIYRHLTGQAETMDNQVRIWMQDYKEDVILRYFQHQDHMNSLDDARLKVRGWGFEKPDARPDLDQYSATFGYPLYQYVARLDQEYIPEKLIAMVQIKVEYDNAGELVREYLLERYSDGDIDDAELARMYEGSNLTLYGSARLLELLGFIDPVP